MINGHGDDLYIYGDIKANFSSNVYNNVCHDALYRHISDNLKNIRSYPEPEPYSLERLIASGLCIGDDEVCVTSGATEAIYLIAMAWRASETYVLAPTFKEYEDACRLHAHKVTNIFSLDDIPSSASTVWLCNPNNPTGKVTSREYLTDVIDAHPSTLFVIDQSYEMFAAVPTLDVREMTVRNNVLMLHSMTKCYAVPGIRLGYVTGSRRLINKVRSCRMPWSVNALAIVAGTFLLKHAADYTPDVNTLISRRVYVENKLKSTGVIDVFPSDTHYMLLRLNVGTAEELKEYLAREHRVLIRNASNFAGLDERYFRIAIQTPEENELLINGIKQWISLL